jgi:hypothetical protein
VKECAYTKLDEHRVLKIEELAKTLSASIERELGIKGCKYNLHKLQHLSSCLPDHGPMPSYWLFSTERYNQFLRNRVHGSHNAADQIAVQVCLMRCHVKYMLSDPEFFWPRSSVDFKSFEEDFGTSNLQAILNSLDEKRWGDKIWKIELLGIGKKAVLELPVMQSLASFLSTQSSTIVDSKNLTANATIHDRYV